MYDKTLKISIPTIFQKIEDVNVNDERFTRVKIWLMHIGSNFNGTYFSEESVIDAIPTLQYIPIVGFIGYNSVCEDDYTQHKYVKIKTAAGVEYKYKGHSYGVILSNEDNNAHFEERLCDDGVTRKYLVVEGIIWNMFEDSFDILNRDTTKNISMELWDKDENSFDGYEDENEIFHFTRFNFRAACILGKDYEPGMEGASIEVQNALCNYAKVMQSELNNKYTIYSKCVKKNKQGGKNEMDNKQTNYSLTLRETIKELEDILCGADVYVDRWGDTVPRYSFIDIQESEVIVLDKKNNYQIYGFVFTTEGDKPVIDFSQCKRKKTVYADYEDEQDDTNPKFNFSKVIQEIDNTAFEKVNTANTDKDNAVTNYEKIQAEYNGMKATYEGIKTEYNAIKPKFDKYVEAEARAEADAILEQKKVLFQKFDSHLSEIEDYAEIKKSMNDLSVEDIETKCSILYAKKSLKDTSSVNYSKKNTSVALDVCGNDDEDEYIQTKYGMIRKNI